MKKLIIAISVLLIFRVTSGQDPHFTQFYANPLYLAPSFAGATHSDRVASVYRNQWASVPNAYVTYTFSYDHFFENFNSGVGLLLMRDVSGSGDLALTNAGLQYSYDININNYWHVRPGVHFNYTQMGIDYLKLRFNNQLTSSGFTGGTSGIPPEEGFVADIDFATSALLYSDRYWFGFAVDHLLKPNYGFWNNDVPLPIKYTVFGGAQVIKRGQLFNPIDESLSLAFLFRHQDVFRQLDLGVYWYKAPLMLGLWYRGVPLFGLDPRGDALAFLVGYKMDDIRVGYSYDFTVSRLVSATGGSHEVSVIFEFSTTRSKKKRGMVPCPEF
ncbi:MAG: type IX secretion system membrane protein PorP/SprF [Bacteroidales bacterium]